MLSRPRVLSRVRPKVFSPLLGQSRLVLPKTNLLFSTKGVVDSIGLSASDYANIDTTVQGIFFSDPSTLRDVADILPLAYASPFLNEGTMTGDEGAGLALYVIGTEQGTLGKALRYFKQCQYLHYTDTFNYTDLENYI